MISHRSTPRLRKSAQRWLSVVLRFGLMIAAWQGPLPWCHAHGVLVNASSANQSWFARHLQARHAGECSEKCGLLGWHVHVDLPWERDEPGNRDAQDQSPPPRLLTHDLNVDWNEQVFSAVVLPTVQSLAVWTKIDSKFAQLEAAIPPTPVQFWDGFAPSLSLPVRLGVIRS